MNFENQTGNTIVKAFLKFHRDNPEIYRLFKQYAFHMIKSRKMKKISSKLIINRIRWEVYVETYRDPRDFKINDAFTAHYARLFIHDHPGYEDFLELRKLRSDELIDYGQCKPVSQPKLF